MTASWRPRRRFLVAPQSLTMRPMAVSPTLRECLRPKEDETPHAPSWSRARSTPSSPSPTTMPAATRSSLASTCAITALACNVHPPQPEAAVEPVIRGGQLRPRYGLQGQGSLPHPERCVVARALEVSQAHRKVARLEIFKDIELTSSDTRRTTREMAWGQAPEPRAKAIRTSRPSRERRNLRRDTSRSRAKGP